MNITELRHLWASCLNYAKCYTVYWDWCGLSATVAFSTFKQSSVCCWQSLPHRCHRKRRCLAQRLTHQDLRLFSPSLCWAEHQACLGPGLWFQELYLKLLRNIRKKEQRGIIKLLLHMYIQKNPCKQIPIFIPEISAVTLDFCEQWKD